MAFRPGEMVEVNLRNSDGSTTPHGQYMVERVTAAGKYTLCTEDGDTCRIGHRQEFAETELTSVG